MRLSKLIGMTVLVVLALPLAALAKGAAGATLEGEGIDGVLTVNQAGELGQGTAMSLFAERAGFFELVFGDGRVENEPLVVERTKPTIVVEWDMMGAWIVQDLYFLEDGSVAAYVAPGQKFWEDTATTVGGWMAIDADLTKPLAELGVDVSVLPTKVAEPAPAPAPKVVTPAPDPVPVDPAPVTPEPASQAQPVPAASSVGSALPILLAALLVGLLGAGLARRRRMIAG